MARLNFGDRERIVVAIRRDPRETKGFAKLLAAKGYTWRSGDEIVDDDEYFRSALYIVVYPDDAEICFSNNIEEDHYPTEFIELEEGDYVFVKNDIRDARDSENMGGIGGEMRNDMPGHIYKVQRIEHDDIYDAKAVQINGYIFSKRFVYYVDGLEQTETETEVTMNYDTVKEKFAFTGIDFDALVTKMEDTYTKYHHANSRDGILTMLNEFITNKEDRIKELMKMPGYNGNLQVVCDISMEKNIVTDNVYNLYDDFFEETLFDERITYINKDGKTYEESIIDKPSVVNIKDVLSANLVPDDFGYDHRSISGVKKRDMTYYILRSLKNDVKALLTETQQQEINELGKDYKFRVSSGMPTIRAFNKFCNKVLGFDNNKKEDPYKEWFRRYADECSEKTTNKKFILSLNPLDYMGMSFGTGWASCHTIDKDNVRNAHHSYEGMYRAGTTSYMLDETSAIMYIIANNNDTHPEDEDKVLRCVMSWNEYGLLEGRVYPNGRDGGLNYTKTFRHKVQQLISAAYGDEYNEHTWVLKGRADSCYDDCWEKTNNYLHYDDHNSYTDPTFSYRKSTAKNPVVIGHPGVCIKCGATYTRGSGYLHCRDCR